MKIYSIYDKKALNYSPVMSFEDEISAIRFFEGIVHDSSGVISRHPTDFVFVEVGSIDKQTGKLTPLDMPYQVKEALAVHPSYIATAPVGEQVASQDDDRKE